MYTINLLTGQPDANPPSVSRAGVTTSPKPRLISQTATSTTIRPGRPRSPPPVHRTVRHTNRHPLTPLPAILRRRIIALSHLAPALISRVTLIATPLITNKPLRPAPPATVDRGGEYWAGGEALRPKSSQWVAVRSWGASFLQFVPATIRIHGVQATAFRDVALAMLGFDLHDGVVGREIDRMDVLEVPNGTYPNRVVRRKHRPNFDNTRPLCPGKDGDFLDEPFVGRHVKDVDGLVELRVENVDRDVVVAFQFRGVERVEGNGLYCVVHELEPGAVHELAASRGGRSAFEVVLVLGGVFLP